MGMQFGLFDDPIDAGIDPYVHEAKRILIEDFVKNAKKQKIFVGKVIDVELRRKNVHGEDGDLFFRLMFHARIMIVTKYTYQYSYETSGWRVGSDVDFYDENNEFSPKLCMIELARWITTKEFHWEDRIIEWSYNGDYR